jgi:hypothetical protein
LADSKRTAIKQCEHRCALAIGRIGMFGLQRDSDDTVLRPRKMSDA